MFLTYSAMVPWHNKVVQRRFNLAFQALSDGGLFSFNMLMGYSTGLFNNINNDSVRFERTYRLDVIASSRSKNVILLKHTPEASSSTQGLKSNTCLYHREDVEKRRQIVNSV